ncbi:DNA polymerase eta isoform X1 [Typha angustifolia]|uniref:DNA polymerase eta isoform X1 n=1 Tax=Typha angustifolia TaxID=59011 RepID=UPI003C2B6FE2
MPIARPEPQEPRVIAHVDMDCFYVQVEQRRNPELRGLPTAVVQYNSWKGGGLIAVSYEARKFGVKRSMRGDEAKKICPSIQLVQVPVAHGKADLNIYRAAGSEVIEILAMRGKCERASIDEVYLDLTDAAKSMLLEIPSGMLESITEEALKSNILGLSSDSNNRERSLIEWFCRTDADHQEKLLACGAIIVAQLRAKVLEETKFTCSAGIAHNKMLAKLASSMHKPAQQTVVPSSSVKDLLASLPVRKMKQLGGKLGSSLQTDLRVNTVGDLLNFTEPKLQEYYGINTGTWLWKIARGFCGEEVKDRLLPKSHGCGKTFPGPQALRTTVSVRNWLNQLCEELSERLQVDLNQNKRVAHTLTLHASAFKENVIDFHWKFPSKSCPLRYGTLKIQEDATKLFDSGLHDFLGSQNISWGITSLSVTASKISDIPNGRSSILRFLRCNDSPSTSSEGYKYDSLVLNDIPLTTGNDAHLENDGYMTSTQNGKGCPIASEEKVVEDHKTIADQGISTDINISGASQGKMRNKEPYSILKFFPSRDSSFSTRKRSFDSLGQVHSGCDEVSKVNSMEQEGTPSDGNAQHRASEQCDQWTFSIADIDASVIDELPLEIQKEVHGWFHASKQTSTNRRGSSIIHYFSPMKKS